MSSESTTKTNDGCGAVDEVTRSCRVPVLLAFGCGLLWLVWASALSFLAWYIFAPQCASTLGVVKRETNSWRWPVIMFCYMITLAYIASFATYHIAVALGAG